MPPLQRSRAELRMRRRSAPACDRRSQKRCLACRYAVVALLRPACCLQTTNARACRARALLLSMVGCPCAALLIAQMPTCCCPLSSLYVRMLTDGPQESCESGLAEQVAQLS